MRLIVGLLATSLAYAQYFPLQTGNQWIYRVDDGPVKELRIAEVLRAETVDDREYFVYRGIDGKTSRIRLNEQNQLVQWNADGGESIWADFAAGEGESFPTAFDDCTGRGHIRTRTKSVDILGRMWEGGIRVQYDAASCADAGVTDDLYLPALGLAERTYQSLTGPRRYKLIYARIGNASVVTSGQYSFRVNLDQKNYAARQVFNVRITLENWTGEALLLPFTSSQSFDFAIRNEAGGTVYVWSADKLFLAMMRQEEIRGEKNWTATEELELPPGEYVLEAWLTTGRTPAYRAQLPFTVAATEPAK
jgi:hypothetical protein